MLSFLKENKRIVRSITKFADPAEVFSEAAGYEHAKQVGLQVAELYYWSYDRLTVEYIDGISCFHYLELLRKTNKDDQLKMRQLLIKLLDDVCGFQSTEITTPLQYTSYIDRTKLDEVVEIMRLMKHPMSETLNKRIPIISEIFNKYAKVPFRDATPKNCLLKNVSNANFSDVSIELLVNSARHIDFRSVAQLTTRYDDIVSVLFHYQIPDEIRDDLLSEYGISRATEEFIVSRFVRLARFWARRHFYRINYPELYARRYPLETLSFYDQEFDDSIISLTQALT